MITAFQSVPTPLSARNFGFVRELLAREAAIVLEPGKEYLVETRLAGLATRHECASVDALVDLARLAGREEPGLTGRIVDALTTNETLFFRDLNPFDALREHVVPRFRDVGADRPFTLWSAAASSGQEAYSVAMLLAEHFPGLPARLVGTDISPTMVERARSGVYQQLEVNRGLPARLLAKYFRSTPEGWVIDEALRRRVEFSVLNLLHPWATVPVCQVVMLRNVMIYFDEETRRRILRRVRGVLAPGGYLVLGGAETPVMLDPGWVPVTLGRATFYQARD